MTLLRWRRRSKVTPPPAPPATASDLWPRSHAFWVPADRAPWIAGAPNAWSKRFDSRRDALHGDPDCGLGPMVTGGAGGDGVPRRRTRPRHMPYW
jgi:hypothetical protein